MIKLILKDILIQKKLSIILFLSVIWFTFIFRQELLYNIITMIVLTPVFCLIIGSYSQEEQNKSYLLINSLPIPRIKIIISKYLSIPLYVLINLAIFIFSSKLLNTSLNLSYLTIDNIAILFVISLIFGAVIFPIYSKWGCKIAKLIYLVSYFLFITIILNSSLSILKFIKKDFILSISNINIFIYLLIAIILYIISMFISINIYKNKDLI